MQYIESKNNALLKEIKKLKDKKYRDKNKQFIVEGLRFVDEALKSSFEVKYIFISSNFEDRWENLLKESEYNLNDIKIYKIDNNIFKSLCNTENPQGILAVIEYKHVNIDEKHGFYILVDKIQDPGNLGTIIRTAHACNALGIILTKGTVDVYNDKTLRATMGSIFHVPIIKDDDLKIVNNLRNKGFKLLVSYLDEETKNIYDVNFKNNVIICIGNEGNGISDEILKLKDQKIKIPMPGGAESLNAAIANSIICYECLRQRNYK